MMIQFEILGEISDIETIAEGRGVYILLEDGETVHNAFFDRSFRED